MNQPNNRVLTKLETYLDHWLKDWKSGRMVVQGTLLEETSTEQLRAALDQLNVNEYAESNTPEARVAQMIKYELGERETHTLLVRLLRKK